MLFTLDNVGYSEDGKTILENINLKIKAGQHLLLHGSSGCGKTTLMNLITGLSKPSSGNIHFNDQNYASLSDKNLDSLRSENFGFIFQKLHLIPHLNVIQNIEIAQSTPDQERIRALISDLGISGKETQKARDLSVGEAQRVAIARAVANNPTVIFADEPTSALDDANTGKVMDLIFDQAGKTGATIIAATHDARIKGRFKDILEMKQ